MKRFRSLLIAVAAVAAVTAVSAPAVAQSDGGYWVDEASLPFEPLEGFEDSERRWGVLGDAGYRIEVPADWNGELVMWTHGYRGEGSRLFLSPEEVPLRGHLLANGYAWAASTYSENDYVVGIGARDTHELAKYFRRSQAKDPNRIYVVGGSMGGHIAARSVERYRSFYDGALPVCGGIGGYELFDYFVDFNLVAQQLALGASQYPVDPTVYIEETTPTIKAALEASPGSWPRDLNEKGEQHKQFVELASGGDRPNFDEGWVFWNSDAAFATGPGNFFFDIGTRDGSIGTRPQLAVSNLGTVYQTDLDPALSESERDLNREIFRLHYANGARLQRPDAPSPQVWGRMTVPVLTLHNLGDIYIPFQNELIYRERVASRGNLDLLVQRAIRGVGHCGFTDLEMETAFDDLVNWVETGVRPEGDDFSSPEAIADPSFGCRFTDFETPNGHLLATPCPDS